LQETNTLPSSLQPSSVASKNEHRWNSQATNAERAVAMAGVVEVAGVPVLVAEGLVLDDLGAHPPTLGRVDGAAPGCAVVAGARTMRAQTVPMDELTDLKAVLGHYLQFERDALLWKLEGLDERELRMPRTPTGTNLIGIVKHMANVELGYFGDTFGRTWPTPEERVSEEAFEAEPQADWYATEDETCDGIVSLYRRVWEFADATIEELPLDAPGRVPWWRPESNHVTLGRIIVHVIDDLARHVGQADIIREEIDGAAGLRAGASNLPDQQDWPAYVARLTELAERF
jgi:uncharacterized damage-inducible protein DinB